jgi:hypothetical protein
VWSSLKSKRDLEDTTHETNYSGVSFFRGAPVAGRTLRRTACIKYWTSPTGQARDINASPGSSAADRTQQRRGRIAIPQNCGLGDRGTTPARVFVLRYRRDPKAESRGV